jgi:CheY-like chemotaxis protein
MRVLVAEHDPWRRQLLVEMLEAAGCSVQQASNGMTALRLAAQGVPQLVLLAANLPELAAAEVQRALEASARTRGVAVVLLQQPQHVDLVAEMTSALRRAQARIAATSRIARHPPQALSPPSRRRPLARPSRRRRHVRPVWGYRAVVRRGAEGG